MPVETGRRDIGVVFGERFRAIPHGWPVVFRTDGKAGPPSTAQSVSGPRFTLVGVESLALMLRAVNVGQRRVPMAALRELLGAAGYEGARTYVQSGNVVLRSPDPASVVAERCRKLISERFGFDVPVVVRTGAELAAVLRHDPFGEVATDPKRYFVSFMDSELPDEARERLEALVQGEERFLARGREIYGWFPSFTARSKLATALSSPAKGVVATARNWTTVGVLLTMTRDGG